MRKLLSLAAVVLALSAAAVQPAQAAEPLRSGTIVATFYPFAPVLAPGPGPDCETNADCLPFLLAHCPKWMAGHNPGLHSSIVSVQSLASSGAMRHFTVRAIRKEATALILGGVAVQFWSRSCRQVAGYGVNEGIEDHVEFTIPSNAAWMTVAAMDSPPLKWALR